MKSSPGLFAGIGLLASPGIAQHQPPLPDAATDIVVTGVRDQEGYVAKETNAAKIAAPLRDIPQSVAVVTEQVLRDQRALSLQDALQNVPGVSLGSGDGQRDQVSIRGFSAIGDQYVDGFRDDGLYFRDLSNVQRVEVIKGPSAVLYGRGSSGGIINRVTKKPDIDILSAALSGGSYGHYRGEFDIGRFDVGSGVGYRVTGAVEDDGSFRDQQFLKRVALAPSILAGRGSDTSILVQADYLKDRRVTDFGIPAIDGRPVDVPRSTYFGAANARDADVARSEVFSQTLTLAHRFSDSLSFRNGFRHYRDTLDRHNTQSSAADPVARTVTLRHGGILRDEDGWSNQAEMIQKLSFAGMQHKILYGFEVSHQAKKGTILTSRIVAETSIDAPVLPTVDNADYIAAASSSLNTFNTPGLYVQDLVDFGSGIKVLAGVRHDRFRQKTDNRLSGQADLARTDDVWSPRAGLVFQPDDAQSYYASYSRSFQPSAETFPLATNNVDIAPEKSTNYEGGAKYTLLGGRLAIQAAGFILRRTGIKGSDPVTQRVIPIGTQRTKGAELSGQLNLANGLNAIFGYAFLDTKVTKSATPALIGKRATITPRNSANLFLAKTIAQRFGIGAGGNYVGNRFADPANTTVVPHYFTVNALAYADIGPARLQMNAYNLFDKKYIVSGHGTSPLLNLPGGPRTVLATIRVGF